MTSISNSEKIGLNNEKNVFHYIRSNSPISRADISREIGLSKPAVSSAVEKLLDKELVLEESAISYDKVGRKPKVLKPNYKAGYFLSSHVGEHRMFFGVSDLSGKILAKDSMETPRKWGSVAKTAIKQIKSVFAWGDI
ncbi:MAG: MarR family transcriptional regulator, partial [Candidatus Bipolaricaulia bacterium]